MLAQALGLGLTTQQMDELNVSSDITSQLLSDVTLRGAGDLPSAQDPRRKKKGAKAQKGKEVEAAAEKQIEPADSDIFAAAVKKDSMSGKGAKRKDVSTEIKRMNKDAPDTIKQEEEGKKWREDEKKRTAAGKVKAATGKVETAALELVNEKEDVMQKKYTSATTNVSSPKMAKYPEALNRLLEARPKKPAGTGILWYRYPVVLAEALGLEDESSSMIGEI